MKETRKIKAQLAKHLQGGMAFMPLQEMIDKVPFSKCMERPHGLPYSVYELMYHLYFAQKDILKFCTAEKYELPDWPDEYWPKANNVTQQEWNNLKQGFFEDRDAFETVLKAEKNSLMEVVKHGDDQNLLRETLLVIEHNAYHTGQLLVLLRLLGIHH